MKNPSSLVGLIRGDFNQNEISNMLACHIPSLLKNPSMASQSRSSSLQSHLQPGPWAHFFFFFPTLLHSWPGIEPVTPALGGRVLTTGPPRKSAPLCTFLDLSPLTLHSLTSLLCPKTTIYPCAGKCMYTHACTRMHTHAHTRTHTHTLNRSSHTRLLAFPQGLYVLPKLSSLKHPFSLYLVNS